MDARKVFDGILDPREEDTSSLRVIREIENGRLHMVGENSLVTVTKSGTRKTMPLGVRVKLFTVFWLDHASVWRRGLNRVAKFGYADFGA